MSAAFIEWRGVHKSFGEKVVLRGFDLSVSRGESVAILGASGVGKSVALRHVIGLTRPDQGSVLVDGAELQPEGSASLLEVRRRIAMVFQGSALFDSMTVGENVAFGLREHRSASVHQDVGARVAEVLRLVALPDTQHMLPSSLSGGMRKRVALARALAVGPEAILYDEPTTGLDPVIAGRVNRLVRDLQRRLEATSIVVTHDVSSAFLVADRIVYLRSGRVEFDGPVQVARDRPPPALAAFIQGSEFAANSSP